VVPAPAPGDSRAARKGLSRGERRRRTRIHKRFLKNFCDVVVEVLKSVSMTEADMRAPREKS